MGLADIVQQLIDEASNIQARRLNTSDDLGVLNEQPTHQFTGVYLLGEQPLTTYQRIPYRNPRQGRNIHHRGLQT